MKPFTKWAGGKRQLLPIIKRYIPKAYNNYYEPFIGGGALFFDLEPMQATINDKNKDLISAYTSIRDDLDELIALLQEHSRQNCKKYYLSVRSQDREETFNEKSDVERAARLIYMLKVDYNELYRVNSKNQFNVPYGNYQNPRILDEDNLRRISDYLNDNEITITNDDFEDVLRNAQADDFVCIDPPYIPLNSTANFTSYTSNGFSYADQERLRDVFIELTERGVKVMLSNSSVQAVRDLYEPYATRIIEVDAN